MAELHFLRPLWFFAFIPLMVLLFVFCYKTKSSKIKNKKAKQQSAWKNEVDAHLLEHVLISFSPSQMKKTKYQIWMFAAFCWTISVFALAGPSWDKTSPIQINPDLAPLVIVLDLSHSMLVRDIYPNRLKHAQYKLRMLIDKMINRPIAMVVYSAQAHSVIPLTQDSRLVTHLLEYMTPDIMPAPGSNHSAGLKLAANILSQNKRKKGQILLVTDGLDDKSVKTIEQLASQDLDVLIYVVATKQGGTIPETENGNKLTDNGKDFSVLDEAGLRQFAQKDLGYYEIVTNDNQDILNLLSQLTDTSFYIESSYIKDSYLTKDETEQQTIQVWRDRGGWLIFLLLPFALLMFRPGFMSVLLSGYIYSVIFFYPVTAEANGWQAIWYNSNTQGNIALANNDAKLAEQLFSEPFWRGVAQYRQQKFKQALENFSSVNSAQGFYNKGNTLVHLKRYKEAMTAYNTALRINDSLTEAKHNLKLVEHFRQQTQSNDPLDLINFNRSKNINKAKALKPLKQLEKLSDKSPAVKADQKQEQDQKKKSADNVDKNSLVKGDINNSAASRSGGQNNKNERSEKPGKRAQQKTKTTQEYKTKTINKDIQNKLTQKKSKQKTNKVSQVNSKKKLTGTENSNQQQKNKTNILSEADNNKLKKSDNNVQKKSDDELKKIVKETAESSNKQEGKHNTSKPENSEITDNENNKPVARAGSKKQAISRQEKKQDFSTEKNEQFQSMEHWLDSINDDPSDLLREKFKREYKKASRFSEMDKN